MPTENEVLVTSEENEVEIPDVKMMSGEEMVKELQKARDALKAANAESAERRRKLKAYDEAETVRLADEKKRRDAELTEVERYKQAVSEAEQKIAAADARAEKAKTAATEKLLRAAVLTEVNTANIDPAEHESVWLLIKNDAALRDAIKPKGDDGFEGVDAVVKKIAEAHPRWLKSEAQGDGVGTGKPASHKTKADLDAEKRIQEQSRKTYQRTW